MSHERPLEERVTQLELLVTHIERTVDSLNAALIGQQKQLDTFGRLLSRLDEQIEGRSEDEEELRDPEAERPPHY
jgi:uncharacterized coiled-coil protein SlyX